jgi:hypothetical protein
MSWDEELEEAKKAAAEVAKKACPSCPSDGQPCLEADRPGHGGSHLCANGHQY